MGLLAEAQVIMVLGDTWRLSWWLYHVTMLAGFVACGGALLVQYRQTGSLAAVVEGLFLRSVVSGIRRGDPQALTALSAAVAAKDGETGAHLERVAALSHAIGVELGLAGQQLEALRWAGRLHDLGKLGVPDAILNKPGKLTEAEFAVIKGHSERGHSIACRSGLLASAAPAIRGHHERWDGGGYPDGLVGEAIPLEARIVAVADVFDALTSVRAYKRAWPRTEALQEVCRQSGRMFDPACVTALLLALQAPEREATAAAA
jgi:HD-GYP domain-containing protein (c-di-GMP phosphodiesterase class II)